MGIFDETPVFKPGSALSDRPAKKPRVASADAKAIAGLYGVFEFFTLTWLYLSLIHRL